VCKYRLSPLEPEKWFAPEIFSTVEWLCIEPDVVEKEHQYSDVRSILPSFLDKEQEFLVGTVGFGSGRDHAVSP